MENNGEDEPVLRVSVTAVPEDGKANKRMIEILAKAWRLPKSAFSIAGGARSRDKTLLIAGDTGDLAERLQRSMEKNDG